MKPHQEEIIQDYIKLYDKRTELAGIINKIYKENLDDPETPLPILQTQVAIMDAYLNILKYRSEIEGFFPEFWKQINEHFIYNHHDKR